MGANGCGGCLREEFLNEAKDEINNIEGPVTKNRPVAHSPRNKAHA
jgi:hypothetical protein